MPIPFVHTADIHLGRLQGRRLSAVQLAQRRADAMNALITVIDTVAAENIPLFFIAGDLFDNALVAKSTAQEICDRLGRLAATRVFIAAGNHDYAGDGSLYRTLSWPGNVRLFTGGWESEVVPSLGVTVHGRGFTAPECEEAWLRNYRVNGDSTLHVVIMHAEVTSGASRYAPVTRADLVGCNADYIALGHLHAPQAFSPGGDVMPAEFGRSNLFPVKAAYSGALEPLDFGDEGAHGHIRGELEKGGARLRFTPTATRTYHNIGIDIGNAATMETVLTATADRLASVPDADLVRIALHGAISPDLVVDMARLMQLGRRFFAFEIEDKTTPGEDVAMLAEGFTVRAGFVRRMLALMASGTPEERERASRALRLGLDALAGREARLP